MTSLLTSDVVLLARLSQGGDIEARNQLLIELRPLITRSVRLIVGAGTPEAEDAAQDALIDVARGIAGLREPQAVIAWGLRVATRRALKTVKKRRLTRLRLLYVEPPVSIEEDDRHLLDLKQAFDTLPPRMRAVAVLRLFSGLSESDTAAALGCSPGAVKAQLHLARRRLVIELSGHGASDEQGEDGHDSAR